MRVAASLLCLLAGQSCSPKSEAPLAKSFVLITLDTTRADALGSLGAPPGLTPNFDRLAEQSLVFTNARTVAPLTLPAHASMLTGLYPPRHALRTNAMSALPQEASTLAERARAAGLETAAFVGAAVLDGRFGLDQGFDVYDAPPFPDLGAPDDTKERPAAEVVEAARRWLAERDAARPFFLWVHVFDAHAPYQPTPEALQRVASAGVPPERRDYLAEVATTDAEIGKLLSDLGAAPRADELVLVLTADHGESLGEHDEATHSALCFDTTLRVPLLLRLPHGKHAGERSDLPVSVVDVFTTALDVLGLPADAATDGVSLLSPAPERGVYFESYDGFIAYGWSPLAGWADREGKYVHSSRPAFFRPSEDPAELTPIASEEGDAYERYRRAIAAVAARPTLDEELAPGGAETAAQLQALGYAGAHQDADALPHPLDPGQRPTPMERTRDVHMLQAAAQFMTTGIATGDLGRVGRAADLLGELVARNPEAWQLKERLALCLGKLGRDEEAARQYEEFIAAHPGQVRMHNNLAVCYFNLGRKEDALREVERALELDPRSTKALSVMVSVQQALGEPAQAEVYRTRLQSLGSEP